MTWDWVFKHTTGAKSVVDLGAGKFEYLTHPTHPAVQERIGLEIHAPYLKTVPPGVTPILGDMRDWKKLIPEHARDVALMIDTLEHIPKEDGEKMLAELTAEFRKVLVFTPLGFMPQDHRQVWERDNVHQDHVSGWTSEELQKFGFQTHEEPSYHEGRGGAIFGLYERGRVESGSIL